MAQHTITISDEDGGLSIRMEISGAPNTVAGIMAQTLSHLIPKLVIDAAKKAAEMGNCPCAKCAAKRAAVAQTEPKPTLH